MGFIHIVVDNQQWAERKDLSSLCGEEGPCCMQGSPREIKGRDICGECALLKLGMMAEGTWRPNAHD